jgi:HEAT repeat protein
VFKSLRSQDVPEVKKTTSGSLLDAVATFAANPTSAISTIRKIHADDPLGLALAAARLVLDDTEKSPGLQYITEQVTGGNLLTDLLLNPRGLPLAAAVAVARKLAAVQPLLDIRLLRNAAATAGGDLRSSETVIALRVLGLVDAISDCSRLSSHLVQFFDHQDAKVRSKAALLLGRSNWNLSRIESLMASDDGRLRANAVESLWGSSEKEVKKILWEATQDPYGRVVVNALLGLCLAEDREAYARLAKLGEMEDPVLRSGAAWAMGQTGDPEFGPVLEKLEQDPDAKVRDMAKTWRSKLRSLAEAPPVPAEKPPVAKPEEPVTPAPKPASYVRIG